MIGWHEGYNGYGHVSAQFTLEPKAATSPRETHAALVLSDSSYSSPASGTPRVDFTTSLRTVRQLRTGSAPNPWEVGWVLWHYTDDSHFYYVNLKPNGWELGKEDPAYDGAQRYLATGSEPAFPVGGYYTVRVVHAFDTMQVIVNGRKLCEYQDLERPYLSGHIGLYCEDSEVTFKA